MKSNWFWNTLFHHKQVGESWDSVSAPTAFVDKELVSRPPAGHRSPVRVCFRNLTEDPVVVCWVSGKGELHHFYKVAPFIGDEDDVTEDDHVEKSWMGDAFCFGLSDDVAKSKNEKKLDRVIGGYRPSSDPDNIHVITICEKPPSFLRGCIPDDDEQKEYITKVRPCVLDPTPLDTTDKVYLDATIGGWPCKVEENWHEGDKRLQMLWEDHLRTATKCLPPHARQGLAKSTPFYINKTMLYGPKVSPIRGSAMCFHPGKGWLEQMGMSTNKAECVEVYCAKQYYDDYELWGPGGVLLHELCHAYHHKMLKDGYENKEIKECWEQAMKDGLYDEVKVHGSQGPTAKAYACENQMEYFAELSVAFLAGKNKSIEYNKWQPFNRSELKEFDPRAYEMLQKVWQVDCEKEALVEAQEKIKEKKKGRLLGFF